jgi:tetratricopeptide (TPR) repeat protein
MTTPFNRDVLPPETLQRLIEILTNFGRITTVPERQTFLQLSGLQSLEPHLHLNETTYQFASELIRESQRIGSFTAGGEPGFYQLLGYLQNEVSGQLEAHEFLSGLRRTATPPVTRADTLQRPSLDFTGRTAEIERLTKALRQGRPVMISGMGGIGKSDLARKVAEEIRAEFPGAALQVELQPDNKPVSATEVVGTLILALAPTRKLPDTLAERVAILRPLMQGQKGILLLDNAAAHEQIQPLENLWHGWAILITSRVRWVVQGGKLERLEPMEINDAEILVATLTENYERTLTEIEVKQVAKACQYHPLALHVASAYLGTFTHHAVENYIEQVRTAPMSALVAPEYANVAQVLGVSIEHLHETNPTDCERWHLLALMPDTFDAELAGALLGKLIEDEEPDVERLNKTTTKATLDTLVRLNLLDTILSTTENDRVRYRLHDFLTDYALRHSLRHPPQSTQDRAVRCHALEVLQWGGNLQDLYLEGQSVKTLLAFDVIWNHLNGAWEKLNQSEDNIATYVTERFTLWLVYFLDLRLPPRTLMPYQEAGIRAARIRNNRSSEGILLGNLGILYKNLGKIQTAINYYNQSLAIAVEINDKRNEGNWLGNLGNSYYQLGNVRTSIKYFEQAVAIAREIEDRRNEGNWLGNLGIAYANVGEIPTAINYHKQALKITREIKDKRNEGNHLGNLGIAYEKMGDTRNAINYQEQALSIAREINDKRMAGNVFSNLGNIYKSMGKVRTAIDLYKQALEIARNTDDKRGEGHRLGT